MTPHSRSRRRVGRWGEWRGVGGWLEEAEKLELEVEVEVEDEAELAVEYGVQVTAPVAMWDAVHKLFTKAVHNSAVHESVHNSFMTTVSVL